jgi:hypothetical protein
MQLTFVLLPPLLIMPKNIEIVNSDGVPISQIEGAYEVTSGLDITLTSRVFYVPQDAYSVMPTDDAAISEHYPLSLVPVIAGSTRNPLDNAHFMRLRLPESSSGQAPAAMTDYVTLVFCNSPFFMGAMTPCIAYFVVRGARPI